MVRDPLSESDRQRIKAVATALKSVWNAISRTITGARTRVTVDRFLGRAYAARGFAPRWLLDYAHIAIDLNREGFRGQKVCYTLPSWARSPVRVARVADEQAKEERENPTFKWAPRTPLDGRTSSLFLAKRSGHFLQVQFVL